MKANTSTPPLVCGVLCQQRASLWHSLDQESAFSAPPTPRAAFALPPSIMVPTGWLKTLPHINGAFILLFLVISTWHGRWSESKVS